MYVDSVPVLYLIFSCQPTLSSGKNPLVCKKYQLLALVWSHNMKRVFYLYFLVTMQKCEWFIRRFCGTQYTRQHIVMLTTSLKNSTKTWAVCTPNNIKINGFKNLCGVFGNFQISTAGKRKDSVRRSYSLQNLVFVASVEMKYQTPHSVKETILSKKKKFNFFNTLWCSQKIK